MLPSRQVIYGDTDSIMVNSVSDDLREAKKMADALKREVNKHYKCMDCLLYTSPSPRDS